MFDIGFGELLLIAVVALVVLGPERLPGAARTVGALLRRVREGWNSVRDEVERELEADELRRRLRETQEQMREAAGTVREGVRKAGEDVRKAGEDLRRAADPSTSSGGGRHDEPDHDTDRHAAEDAGGERHDHDEDRPAR